MRWIFFTLLVFNLGLAVWQLALYQGWVVAKAPLKPELGYLPTAGAATVKLLSEAPPVAEPPPAPSEPAPALAQPPVATSETPPPQDDHRLCLLFGPYEKVEEANGVITRLAAAEIKSHINEIEIHLTSNFQVYLDPFENRAKAKAKLEQLQGQGIDSFIIPKGELSNGIALGSFDNERAAKEQAQMLQQKGVEAKIRDSKRPLKETWVALEPGAEEQLGPELKANLLKNKLVEERQILCTAIARP